MFYTIGWIVLLALGAALELAAVFNKRRGDTLSEHVWKWFMIKDARPTFLTWCLRALLLGVMLGLTEHFVNG